jgi:hypothetical protein
MNRFCSKAAVRRTARFPGEVVVAGARVAECLTRARRAICMWGGNRPQGLDCMRDLRPCQAVIAVSAFPRHLDESALKQLREMHAR